jgi:hypothetical protein
VSLILEALRKLERDKAAPDRGFVVMTASTWPAGGTRRRTLVAVALMFGAAILGLAVWATTRTSGRVEATAAGLPPSTVANPAVREVTTPALRPAVPVPPPPREARAPLSTAPPPEPTAPPDLAAPATVRTASAAPKPTELRLQAISQRDGRPIALLNDRLVREGESFDGVLIVAIRADEVEVEVDGRRKVLKF